MSLTIWKYELQAADSHTVNMPISAKFLSLQTQNGRPWMWFLVNPETKTEVRTFRTFGTGHPVPDNERLDYLGTYQLHGGQLVFHVFEVIN